jgi:hypothetical protein
LGSSAFIYYSRCLFFLLLPHLCYYFLIFVNCSLLWTTLHRRGAL